MATATSPAPVIAQAQSRMILYRHRKARPEAISDVIGPTFDVLYQRIGAAGIAPAGPPLVVYTGTPGEDGQFEMDICVPVAAPISPSRELEFRTLPAQKVVRLLHSGPYDTLGSAYERMARFLAENRLEPNGPPREIYLTEPDVPAAQIRTEIEQPVA